MRFMVLVKAEEKADVFVPPSKELMSAIGTMAENHFKAGKMIETGGLQPSADGTRLRLSGGKISVTDGPFTESKELVGGFAIFQVDSKDEMIQLTKNFLQVHADILGPSYETECELRQIFQAPNAA